MTLQPGNRESEQERKLRREPYQLEPMFFKRKRPSRIFEERSELDDLPLYILLTLVSSVVMYGLYYIGYLLNRAFIHQLLDLGIALPQQYWWVYGFATGEWWAFVAALVSGFLIAVVLKHSLFNN
jgi:hypothetical protein